MMNQSRAKQTVLVTGAAGFIGSFLCEELLLHQYSVVGVDNFFRGKFENISHLLHQDFIIKDMDLSLSLKTQDLHRLIIKHNITIVIHLAAINGTQYFYDQPFFVLDQNIKMTQTLLSATLNTPVTYIIYSSSSEVYGNPLVFPTDEEQPILLHAYSDRDSYASSKAICEFYMRLFSMQHDLAFLNLRLFNTYGPRMVGTRYGQVIPEFIQRLLYEDQFTLLGDGSQTRTFCYVQDTVAAIRALMQKNITGVLNVGTEHETTILALAKQLHALEHKKLHLINLEGRPDDHPRRHPDIRKLLAILPTLEFTPLKIGLKNTIDYYREHHGNSTK